ncbi:hypothetical protein EMPS_05555 [Entomortierella parvispora]|uniref:F-box domain-containing protein n=1 Tax=Entomortierella parvispora TaxID=205924 RepID=A0A9P3HAP2_9FUNG|nr:hypothetical protein EMPS_05555 [Entomortierella parvispora]
MAPSIDSILDNPQIGHRITALLRQHDLAQCVLVSQTWYRVLTPHLWSLLKGFNIRYFKSPEARAALIKNGPLIRTLKTSSHEFLTYLGSSCQDLTTFDFSGSFPLEGREDGYVEDLTADQFQRQLQESRSELPDSGGNNDMATDPSTATSTVSSATTTAMEIQSGARAGQQQQQHLPRPQQLLQHLTIMQGFLHQNENISILSFRRWVSMRRYLDRLLTDYQILERLPHLKDLTLTSKTLNSSALVKVLQHGHKLERLVLKVRQIEWQIGHGNHELGLILQASSAQQPWKLKELYFGTMVGIDLGLIVKTAGPSLESLRLERLSLFEAQGLSKIVRDFCPRLEKLMVMTDNKIDKNGLTLLLDAAAVPTLSLTPTCKKAQLQEPADPTPSTVTPRTGGLTRFQGHALDIPDFLVHRMLSKHYATLDFLDLSRSRGVRSDTVQLILCHTPNLRVLDLTSDHLTLETKDIVLGPRWVCHRIEVFRITIVSSPPPYDDLKLPPPPLDADHNRAIQDMVAASRPWTEMEIQRYVLAQIGTFTRLNELMVGGTQGRSLQLSLGEGGLELLVGLKKMRNFNIKKMGYKIGSEELEWITEHWPLVKPFLLEGQ